MSPREDQEAARFHFGPLDRRGLLLGLGAAPLVTLAAGLVAAVVVLRAVPGAAGPAGALAVAAAAAAAACWPVGGQPPVSWLPVAGRWASRSRTRLDHTPDRGRRLGPADPAGPGDPQEGAGPADGAGPAGGQDRPATAARREGARLPAGTDSSEAQRAFPAAARAGRRTAPAGIRLLEAPGVLGEAAMGVVEDAAARTWAAVIPVEGSPLGLLGPPEQAARLAGWGALLAGAARDGSPVRRLQWVQRSSPADPDPLRRAAGRLPGPPPAAAGYRAVVEEQAPSGLAHRAVLVVAVRPPRRGGSRAGGVPALQEALRREVRLLTGQLGAAGLRAAPPLDLAGLAAEVRAGADPTVPAPAPGAPRSGEPPAVWPAAVRDGWASARVDGTWQVTYWVAEWPRLEVGPDFLGPLLAGTGRVVAVTLAPVPDSRAVREVQAARTSHLADEALRSRAGFLPSARRDREAAGVRRREEELAAGHAEYRFSGYVTVCARSETALDAACARTEASARQAHLLLRRLYGRQAEARTWTLPLARGVASR